MWPPPVLGLGVDVLALLVRLLDRHLLVAVAETLVLLHAPPNESGLTLRLLLPL